MNNPLTQYIDLYRHNTATINANAPQVLNVSRAQALANVEHVGEFPRQGSDGYEKVSLPDMFASDYGVNIARVKFPVDPTATFRCGVPHVSTLLAFVSGDGFVPSSTLGNNLPAGVTVMSLADAARLHPDIVASRYNTLVPDHNVAANLNTMLCQDGVFVHVSKDVKCDKPIQIVNIFDSLRPMMAVRRMLVVLDDGAEASMLVCDHSAPSSRPDVDYLSNQVVEIVLGRGARLDICDMEESSPSTKRLSQVFADQSDDSVLTISSMSLVTGTTRNNFIIDINGSRCETRLGGIVIGSGSSFTDNGTLVRHHAPRSHSDQLFKYALDDSSRGAFEGSIVVDEAARFTSAYQTNRNFMASAEAKMHTRPQLEIYCDEVKCSHGASTGQLDANALFYMRTRGIPEAVARKMLVQAFMADVIDSVGIESLRERLHHIVERRLSGEMHLCNDCRGTEPTGHAGGGSCQLP